MPQTTLADFETRVWTKLDNNQQLYQQSSVDRLINEASRVVNLFSGFSQSQVAIGLTVANWQWYRVPAPIVFPMQIFMENRLLYKSSAGSTAATDRKWIRGGSGSYTRTWIPVGTRMFGINPTDPSGGKYLECWGITTPALLVNPGDSLVLDDEYAELIVEYAFLNLVLKEGGKPFADASKGYQNGIKRMRSLQRWEGKINPRYFAEVETKTETPVPA
jgi:hypothetical protein